MSKPPSDRIQGTLSLLILRILERGPMHGWAIAQRLQELSQDALQVGQGSLYPALHRLADEELVAAEWGISEAGRRARFYRLTREGKHQLKRERESWETHTAAVQRVLRLA